MSSGPFVAANVAVSLEPYAKIPGGPLAFAAPDDGSGRLFVATQAGQIWAITNGVVADHPMLDISKRITSGGERGLLGIAFYPGFPTVKPTSLGTPRAPLIVTDYTDLDGNTVVSSFPFAQGDPSRLDPSLEAIYLHVDQPFSNHNGGGLVFDPTGNLYVALGDGGSEGDPSGNGQSLKTYLAKILRFGLVERLAAARSIPADNPFATRPGAHPGRSWDTADWVADPSAAAAALSWKPRVDLAEGLRRCWVAR